MAHPFDFCQRCHTTHGAWNPNRCNEFIPHPAAPRIGDLRPLEARIAEFEARVAELERAIRFLALAAYRDGCTSWVAASALDEALALVGLPRAEGREPGEPTASVGGAQEDVCERCLDGMACEKCHGTGVVSHSDPEDDEECPHPRAETPEPRMVPERDALRMLAALVEAIGGTATIGRHVLERAADLTLMRSDDAIGMSITFRTT